MVAIMQDMKREYSNSLARSHLIILYITTFGLYTLYWFYKTSKALYSQQGINNKYIWRTLGLCVPILNVYLLWTLFKDIQKSTGELPTAGLKSPSWLTITFIVSSVLYQLPGLWSFLGFLSVLPIITVQTALNRYWQREQPTLAIKTRLSWLELLVTIIGACILVLVIIGGSAAAIT